MLTTYAVALVINTNRLKTKSYNIEVLITMFTYYYGFYNTYIDLFS